MDYLVIKAIIWIFFILSAILEVNYKKKYGIAFNKGQWIAILVIVIISIIFNLWLGGTHLALRGLYIAIESIIALIVITMIGRKNP
ncbi:MAG: amino acid permease, partial [Lactobacillus johnsonii]|nr:amino acid permease [Lactobacillus johnsonii]